MYSGGQAATDDDPSTSSGQQISRFIKISSAFFDEEANLLKTFSLIISPLILQMIVFITLVE
ncbi:MAG: hypothetical protein ACXWCA_05805 [Kaistella sp.]